MAKPVNKKFAWLIKNFTSLQSERLYSAPVLISDCNWRLIIYPKGDYGNSLSLFLGIADSQSLPPGWKRYVKFRLSIVNQLSEELSIHREERRCYDAKCFDWGYTAMLPLTQIYCENGGFLVNNEIMIAAEVNALQVIGTLGESKEFEEVTKPLSKMKENNGGESKDLLKGTSLVNGFQVLPSQVESVKRIFERHPDITVEFRAKNQRLRTACMNFLLSLIETLCQSLQELSSEDLVEVDIALTYLKDAGFKVDWLEKKLDQVKQKKEKEQAQADETRMKDIEEELKYLKLKSSVLEALLEKEKSEAFSIGVPLKFDDVV